MLRRERTWGSRYCKSATCSCTSVGVLSLTGIASGVLLMVPVLILSRLNSAMMICVWMNTSAGWSFRSADMLATGVALSFIDRRSLLIACPSTVVGDGGYTAWWRAGHGDLRPLRAVPLPGVPEGRRIVRAAEQDGHAAIAVVGHPGNAAGTRAGRPDRFPVERRHLERIVELVQQGAVRPPEIKRLPLAEPAAHELSQTGHVRGKIVLEAR